MIVTQNAFDSLNFWIPHSTWKDWVKETSPILNSFVCLFIVLISVSVVAGQIAVTSGCWNTFQIPNITSKSTHSLSKDNRRHLYQSLWLKVSVTRRLDFNFFNSRSLLWREDLKFSSFQAGSLTKTITRPARTKRTRRGAPPPVNPLDFLT